MNLFFTLHQMAAILYFNHNAMTKVRSGRTTMSDIPGNPKVHTRIVIRYYFVETDINVLFLFAQMGTILDFTHMQCLVC